MFYTIYKTNNIINNKYYIGKHQTENINDAYFGSGKALQKAIKKYGKENFKKEILFIFDSEELMNNKEKELVTVETVNDKMSYNMGVGGEGGPHFKNKKHSEETKKICSEASKNRIVSQETKNKISESNKNRIVSQETKNKIALRKKEAYKNPDLGIRIGLGIKKYYDIKGRKDYNKRIPICDSPSKKRCIIYRGDDELQIFIEEKDFYLKEGWKAGRCQKFKNNISNKLKEKVGEKCSTYNRIWICNLELKINKMIKKELLEEFLKDGWNIGRIRKGIYVKSL